jgi:Modifier of rudimentary (Mod(r)) protein
LDYHFPFIPDDSTYDTIFQSIYGDTLILRVHWPALTEQTQLPPAMTLAGVNARHPWLDHRMRVIGYEPIQSYKVWVSSRILLGTAVHEVVKHLQINPPEIIEITDSGLRSIQQPKTVQQQQLQKQQQQQQQNQHESHFQVRTSNTHGNSPTRTPATSSLMTASNPRSVDAPTNNGYIQQPSVYVNEAPPRYESLVSGGSGGAGVGLSSSLPDIDMPPIPNRFDELDKLSRDELEKLCEDDMEFTLFCNKLPIIQTYHKILSSVIDDNAVQAKKNLSKQEEIQELYQECVELETKLKESIRLFQELELKQNEYCQPPDTKVILKELAKSKKEALDESEQIAQTWLDDNASNVDDFLSSFIATRKLHHERAAKMELLLTQQQQN